MYLKAYIFSKYLTSKFALPFEWLRHSPNLGLSPGRMETAFTIQNFFRVMYIGKYSWHYQGSNSKIEQTDCNIGIC